MPIGVLIALNPQGDIFGRPRQFGLGGLSACELEHSTRYEIDCGVGPQ